jgi:hypothetical protein
VGLPDPYAMALAPSSICTSGKAPELCPCMVGRSFPQAPTLHHPACKGGQVPGFPYSLKACVLVGQAHGGQLAVHGGRVSVGEGWVTIEPVRAVHTFTVWSGWLSSPGAASGLSRLPCLPGGGLGEVATLGEAEPRTGAAPGLVPFKTKRGACSMKA